MDPGWPGILLPTVLHLATLAPHSLKAVTQTGGAPVYGFGKSTDMEGVFCPETIVQPAGTVQLYPVAPVTNGTENITVPPGQIFEGPVIAPGTAGLLVIVTHLGALVDDPPQERDAVTHNCPDTKAGGNVTCTFCVPCPDVMGVADPASVQL